MVNGNTTGLVVIGLLFEVSYRTFKIEKNFSSENHDWLWMLLCFLCVLSSLFPSCCFPCRRSHAAGLWGVQFVCLSENEWGSRGFPVGMFGGLGLWSAPGRILGAGCAQKICVSPTVGTESVPYRNLAQLSEGELIQLRASESFICRQPGWRDRNPHQKPVC